MLACALVGLGAGLATGFVLSEVFGAGGPHRMGRLLGRRWPRIASPAAEAALLARVRGVLAADPALAAEPIEVCARGRGLELRGWVATRAARSLAYRLARASAGFEVGNHLLVHGEDDQSAARKESSRTA